MLEDTDVCFGVEVDRGTKEKGTAGYSLGNKLKRSSSIGSKICSSC